MAEGEFMETVDTVEEGDTVASKLDARLCVATGIVTLGLIGGTKSKGGFRGRGGINNVVHRSVGSMVAGGNTYWESMSRSDMKAVTRAGFCCWRRDSAIRMMQILMQR